jgi:hypothetical protein
MEFADDCVKPAALPFACPRPRQKPAALVARYEGPPQARKTRPHHGRAEDRGAHVLEGEHAGHQEALGAARNASLGAPEGKDMLNDALPLLEALEAPTRPADQPAPYLERWARTVRERIAERGFRKVVWHALRIDWDEKEARLGEGSGLTVSHTEGLLAQHDKCITGRAGDVLQFGDENESRIQ